MMLNLSRPAHVCRVPTLFKVANLLLYKAASYRFKLAALPVRYASHV